MNKGQDGRASGCSMTTPVSLEMIRETSSSRGEPQWLTDARLEAFSTYQKLEAPQWRRTDIKGLDFEGLAGQAFAVGASFVTHHFGKLDGVNHMSLALAAREHEDVLKPLMQLSPRADKWEALQAALWVDGNYLHIAKDANIERPLEMTDTFTPKGGLVRNVLVADQSAKAHVLLTATGGAPGAFAAQGTEVQVAPNANLTLTALQDVDHAATLLAWRRAHIQRDATLSWVDGQFGAKTSVTINENLLVEPGANVHFIAAFFGSQDQHLDMTTAALHDAPHTSSQLDIKGALNDHAYAANYAITNIGHDAPNSSGHQHQETLLLSNKARADAIPKLDVENNEVSASHGATVGQVDPDQLFYLRSRGFEELPAKRLIVEGFFDPLLARIPIESVRESMRTSLLARLH